MAKERVLSSADRKRDPAIRSGGRLLLLLLFFILLAKALDKE